MRRKRSIASPTRSCGRQTSPSLPSAISADFGQRLSLPQSSFSIKGGTQPNKARCAAQRVCNQLLAPDAADARTNCLTCSSKTTKRWNWRPSRPPIEMSEVDGIGASRKIGATFRAGRWWCRWYSARVKATSGELLFAITPTTAVLSVNGKHSWNCLYCVSSDLR